MAFLKYDTDKMISVKATYKDKVAKMDEIQDSMQKMVKEVKKNWKSDAGTAFFEKYDEEWLKGFEQYKEVLNHMADNLNIAQDKYSEVTELAKNTQMHRR